MQNISFSQHNSQKIAIAGASGSGKSTLLKIIAGLVQPDEGEVLFNGERVAGPYEKLIPGHPEIAYLSQQFELRNNYRVEEILAYANTLPEESARNLFEICRIDHLLKRRTEQVSGGERQRIALARLLTTVPKLLLLDEPFSNLDLIHKSILKSVINDIGEKLNITCTLVSHDPEDILPWANEIVIMEQGQMIQKGSPHQIYNEPINEYTAALFGKYNLIHPADIAALPGMPGIHLNGKKIFIRPEFLKIVAKQEDAIKGKIHAVRFFGGHYETEVLLAEGSVIVKTTNPPAIGDSVYISLDKDSLWYI